MVTLQTMRDEFRYGKDFLVFAFLRMFGQVLLFGVPLLVAKFLAPEAFGAFALSMMIVYFFSSLLIAPSENPFIVQASEELRSRKKINRTLTSWLIILVISFIIFGSLSVLFTKQLSQFATISPFQFVFLFLAFLGISLRRFMGGILMALDKKGAYTALYIVSGAISIVYLLLVYFFFNLTLEAVFLVFFIAPLASFLLLFKYLDREKMFPLAFDRALFMEMLGHLKWTVLGATAMYLFSWGDNLVLRYFVSLKDIGTYNLGYQIFKGTLVLTGTIKLYFLPILSRNKDNPEKIMNYLSHKRRQIMLLGSVALVLFIVALPSALRIFYGSTYEDAIPVALILLISAFFTLHRVFYDTLFSARKMFRFTQLATVSFVTLNIGLDILLVTRLGAIGAAIATTITYIGYSLVYEIYYRKYVRSSLLAATQ